MEIIDIRMLKSEYQRNMLYDAKKESSPADIKYTNSIRAHENSTLAVVVLKVQVSGKENAPFSLSIEYGATFKMESDDEIERIDEFMRVNAPAILYPYIREHATLLTLKGELKPIYLPPVRFSPQDIAKQDPSQLDTDDGPTPKE